ncbi:phage protein NinX family protein [Burkholderia gladioli]|uniref:phage protein NinX family protein n=1 Tax=Burkholderia gladioli TaxID=28095 RepID=UPI00163F6413|nr:phage protein NinX family protein [Burkholderia gladioli]
MKVADLAGAELDYWVARAEGYPLSCDWSQGDYILIGTGAGDLEQFAPSTDWADGGPIIGREQISIWRYDWTVSDPINTWFAATNGVHGWDDGSIVGVGKESCGETALIAAMRAYVASRFGDEVPQENI